MTTFNSIGVGRTIGAGLNDLHATDFQISTNSTNGIITLNLPPISDVLSERFRSGYFQLIAFLIADISGTAGTFKTIINASSGELINGVSSIDLNTNNYSALLTITSDGAWSLLSGVSSGGSPIPPPFNNPFDFYLDASAPNGGDGSVEAPFNTITSLNNAVIALANPTQGYVCNIAPSNTGYGSEVVGSLPIAPNLSLVGQTPQNTGIVCNISYVGIASGNVVQYRNLAFNGIFNIDLSLATFASISFQNGVVNINRTDSNPSGFVSLSAGIGGATISGTVLIENGVMLGDVTINDGANVFAVNTFIISGIFKLNGNSTLKTLSTLNPSSGYVDGTVNISGTPTWITDHASNETYTGTLTKSLLLSTPLQNVVYVSKNGNDTIANGSQLLPFLTVQAGMNYAYTTYVEPLGGQQTSPFTRPCVSVSAGTYNETFVLPPQICVLGEGYNHTRLVGDWSIDDRWANYTPPNTLPPNTPDPTLVENDTRSTWQSVGLFGNITFDFETVQSNEGKLYANFVRFAGIVNISAKTTNPVSNSMIINSCEFTDDFILTGISTRLINCVQLGGSLILNQSLSSSADNLITTSGGRYLNIIVNSTDSLYPPYTCEFNHSIASASTLTLNGQYSTINSDISSLPIPSLITLLGGATLNQIVQINPVWVQGGNKNGSEQSIGTNDAFDFPIIVNGVEVGRFTTDKRLFLGDTKTNNGSNAGMQYSSLISNRSQLRENQYGANNAGGGITTFKSRGLIIGDPITPAVPANNVIIGDIIQGFTAIGLTDNGGGVGLIPLAYTQRVVVVQNANGSVACDWEISLCPLNGTTNSIRKTFGFTSEGIQKTLETANGMSGLAVLDATGTIVVANTNVKASTKFMVTVQDGGTAPTGNVYQSARVNGTSFTIKSNAGVADAGVQVYYQLYEPIV